MNTRERSLRAAAVTAGLLLTLAAAPVPARLLVDGAGLRASAVEPVRCGGPVTLELEADSPDLLAADSEHAQGVFDAARAVLGYECRTIPEIAVTGRLRGMTEVAYSATASARNGWLLEPSQSLARSSTAPVAVAERRQRFEIRSLTTGMTVNAALQQARGEFDVAPDYDAARRELVAVRGSCDIARAARPAPGWYCLKAQFTDGPDPRLFGMTYLQVVDQNQADVLRRQLTDAFGEPVVNRQARGGESPVYTMAWGERFDVRGRGDGEVHERHALRARVRVASDVTVVSLDLLDPGLLRQAPQYRAQF